MTKKEATRINHQESQLLALGFTTQEAEQLRRISLTLHRWFEHECNGAIQRDDNGNGAPYWYSTFDGRKLGRAADRERGAARRLCEIIETRNERANIENRGYSRLESYVQGDPRGAALYILRPGDIPSGKDVHAYYSRGICVY